MSSVERYSLKDGSVRWMVRYRVDGRQVKSKGHLTKRDARLFAATVETKVASGQWIDPQSGKVSVGTLWADYAAGSTAIKETTRATRRVTWAKWVKPRWGDTPVGRIRVSQIRTWTGQMVADGAGPATVANALSILRGVLALAVEDRLIESNPAAGVKPPRRTPKVKVYLTHAQVDLITGACADAQDACIVGVLAYCGLRFGELAALRVSDVDFLRKRINVSRSVSDVRGKGLVWSSPKTYEQRSVPIAAHLLSLLSAQAAGRGRSDLLFGDGQTPIRVNNWRSRRFYPAVKAARKLDDTIPAVTVHDLRATCISLALSAGAGLKQVQMLAGHSSGAVTANVYGSLMNDDVDRVAKALDRQRAEQTGCAPAVPSADQG
ncbi:MAG: site-specific integrase [Mycobacterium sp.]|nr:MAG: site-specific integrase [Mycobacterium sp.]